MSRHRNVRSMNYEEEYEGYDDVYGHSVEDDYCVSPATASQFLYDRGQSQKLSSFFQDDHQIPEEVENEEDDENLQDSSKFSKPRLSSIEESKLNSCLDQMRDIIGESTPEHLMTAAAVEANFDHEKALHIIFNQQERSMRIGESKGKPQTRGNQLIRVSTEPQFHVMVDEEPATKALKPRHTDLSPNVARMTFTSNTAVASGFSPEMAVGRSHMVEDVMKGTLGPEFGRGLRPVASAPCLETMMSPKRDTPSKSKQEKMDLKREYERRKTQGKEHINLVVIGHVDAGKSTLMGHLLYQLGFVNKKTMHKYEQEAKKRGKASFAYAWVLDETEEERSRGVTMDIAQTQFETKTKAVSLLDAPGHKDFIPNMITGAAQADVAILVVNATRGEFETGFEAGGQTREHAMLIRSLGVSQLCVAINKMDTVEWCKDRYDEIVKKLGQFLKQAGFRGEDIPFIPVSGLSGENLCKSPSEARLAEWYIGPTLADQIDQFRLPEREIDKPFRMCVVDTYKGVGSGYSSSGTILAGSIQIGDRVLIMPQAENGTVKSIQIDELYSNCAFAGDNICLTITGIDMTKLSIGSILCNPMDPVKPVSCIKARVVIFNIELPITKGFNVVFHYQSMSEPAHIRKLISLLHKSTGEVIKKKPRCLTKNSNAMVEIELDRPICIELYKDCKDLGRFMLRYAGSTIAAGLVTEIKDLRIGKVE